MKAVALVGGQGTRLRPLTFRTPKPLLPLVNRPLLEFVVERCKRNEISDLILSTNYLPDLFRNALGDSRDGISIEYVHEIDALGTAGGVKNCESRLQDTFYVFNGDVLTGLDLVEMLEFHRARKAAVTIYLTPVDDPRAYGVVALDSDCRVEAFVEKPSLTEAPSNLINGGVYIIEPEVLARIPAGIPYSFERQLFPDLVADKIPIYGHVSEAYWLDIGTPEKYLQAHFDILTNVFDAEIPGQQIAPGLWVAGGTEISEEASINGPAVIGAKSQVLPGARLEGPVSIGAGCSIGESTRISRSALADGVLIGRQCSIEDSLIGEAAVIDENCVVAELAVIGPGASIAEGNELRRGMRVWPDVEVGPSSIQF